GLKAELGSLDDSKTLVGWTGGLGLEDGFSPKWAAEGEYFYMDLGSPTFLITRGGNCLQGGYLRLGFDYSFLPPFPSAKKPRHIVRGFLFSHALNSKVPTAVSCLIFRTKLARLNFRF